MSVRPDRHDTLPEVEHEDHPWEGLLVRARAAAAAFASMTPEDQIAMHREQAIDFVYGNLAASSNHQVSRELVGKIYDEMHGGH